MNEPWRQAQYRAGQEDRWLRRRPVCADCGRHIAEGWCFPLEDGGVLCEKCMRARMIEVLVPLWDGTDTSVP